MDLNAIIHKTDNSLTLAMLMVGAVGTIVIILVFGVLDAPSYTLTITIAAAVPAILLAIMWVQRYALVRIERTLREEPLSLSNAVAVVGGGFRPWLVIGDDLRLRLRLDGVVVVRFPNRDLSVFSATWNADANEWTFYYESAALESDGGFEGAVRALLAETSTDAFQIESIGTHVDDQFGLNVRAGAIGVGAFIGRCTAIEQAVAQLVGQVGAAGANDEEASS